MKKYLKTIEDIEALTATDTKIYKDNNRGYYKFVRGVPCFFGHDSTVFYNATIDFDEVESELYIEVEDEPSEDYIGKLGWFWDYYEDVKYVDVLGDISTDGRFEGRAAGWYEHFRPLTPEEVEKYTGYKVVNNEMQANTLANNKMQAKEEQ